MATNYPFLDPDRCKKLKEFGVPQKSIFFWIFKDFESDHLLASRYQTKGDGVALVESDTGFHLGDMEYSAWTAEELIAMMPKRLEINGKEYCPLFVEKHEWHGHENAFRCYYLSNSFGIRMNKKGKVESRILATVMEESLGYTLVDALANLYIKIIERKLVYIHKGSIYFKSLYPDLIQPSIDLNTSTSHQIP